MKQRKPFIYSLSIITLLLFIVGCQSTKTDGHEEFPEKAQYKEPTDPSTFGELPETFGDKTFVSPYQDHFPFQINEDIDQLSYEEPTGTWFMADGEGVFGYTIPNGSFGAGDQFEVGLIHATQESNVMERDVRIQLTPCAANFICSEPILTTESFVEAVDEELFLHKGTLPPAENQLYILSMEVIHEGTVEDTLISYVYVPEKSLNASIELDEYREGNERTFTLTNHGPTFLFIGQEFFIEQLVDDTWMTIPYQTSIDDIGIYIAPGATHSHTIDVATFPAGTYRFIKQMDADVFDLDATIATPFEVE